MNHLTLDAPTITDWQSCKRKYLLNQNWRPVKWRPAVLFDACLRQAIYGISNGKDAITMASDARAAFLLAAANPGMEVPQGSQPYTIAKDWCAMLETIIRAVSRLTLLTLHEPASVELDQITRWQPLAWADDSGQLHRWITVDRWDEDALYREMHGWRTFGDIAMTECPMMLHVVEIGQQREGRRASSWARGWIDPRLGNLGKMRFVRRDRRSFNGWKPVYLSESSDYESWVEQLVKEGETERLMRHITINVPSKRIVADTRAQILKEAYAMRELDGAVWTSQPMSRGACDLYAPCVFQPVCFSEQLIQISKLGLYEHRRGLPCAKIIQGIEKPYTERIEKQPHSRNAVLEESDGRP